jgi:hypothetical protein
LKNERDGYQENTVTGCRDSEEQNVTAGRVSLLWEASDSTTTRLASILTILTMARSKRLG